jgi:hypothetical protein
MGVNGVTLIRPILGFLYQPRSHLIFANVIPFLAIALVASQYVIEETARPYWAQWHCRRDRVGKMLFQRLDPMSQFQVVWPIHEKVQVISHDDVPTYGDVVHCMRAGCES